MSNKVQEFLNEKFGEVRVVLIDKEPWFIAKDIADRLKYNETNAMTKKIDDEDIRKIASDNLEGANNMAREFTIINESGLFQSILSITKKDIERYNLAKEFKKWITGTVIPAIRKDGAYISGEENLAKDEMSEDEFVLQAMTILQNKITRLKKENEEMKPKVGKWEKFLDSNGTYSFTEVSKLLSTMSHEEKSDISISVIKLTDFLRKESILSKAKTPDKDNKKGSYKNLPNKDFENYFDVVSVETKGHFNKTQTKVKASGVEFIYDLVKNKYNKVV